MILAWLMPNLHVTGGARVAVELANGMVERGHRVYILIPAGRNRLQIECKAEVIECGIRIGSPLWAVPFALATMPSRLPQVDLLLASMPPYALLARSIGRNTGVPTINYVMNDDVHFFDDRTHLKTKWLLALYRTIARRSIRRGPIMVNSHWTGVRCVAEKGARPEVIVPHGYDPKRFNCNSLNKKYSGPIRLVTIGRKECWKGLPELVTALNMIDVGANPFILRIISQDQWDLGSTRFPLEWVKPSGDQDLVDLYRWGDIFIHSSWFEGFGIPPLEAQACGLAVVATDSGGIREFLRDSENAVIVSPREPRSLARAVLSLIQDGELRGRLIARGLETCCEFTWQRAVDKFEAYLTSLTSV